MMLDQQMLQTNFPSNRNQGYSSRDKYDKCYNNEQIERSVGPLLYKLNPNQINNCNSCLSVFGPRGSAASNHGGFGYGDSTSAGVNAVAPAQALVDVDSIMSNRNVIASKCNNSQLQHVNLTDQKQFQLQHPRICNSFLDPVATHLTQNASLFREVFTTRFIDLGANPQQNIYWDSQINTSLENRDNYVIRVPNLVKYDPTMPTSV